MSWKLNVLSVWKAVTIGSVIALLIVVASVVTSGSSPVPPEAAEQSSSELSLITSTPEEGFALALRLSRLGVTETQPDRDVLHAQRAHYSTDADALIAASHVVAVHFQTIAAANDYWR
jgi:hypothetical protein